MPELTCNQKQQMDLTSTANDSANSSHYQVGQYVSSGQFNGQPEYAELALQQGQQTSSTPYEDLQLLRESQMSGSSGANNAFVESPPQTRQSKARKPLPTRPDSRPLPAPGE